MRTTPFTMPGRLALMFATALVAACGGGGGGGDAPTATSPTAPVTQPSADDPTQTCGLANFAAQALALVNQRRAAGANCGTHGVFAPAAPLTWKARLNQAANGHSADMSAQNYFSHTSLDGRTLSDRINATGYAWSSIGENIAAGYPTVQAVVDGWMASDGHCANIMEPNFSEIGLACVPGTQTSTYNNYWTMDLGKPR